MVIFDRYEGAVTSPAACFFAKDKAMARTVEWTLPLGIVGKTEASAMKRFEVPCTRRWLSTTESSGLLPMRALQHQCAFAVWVLSIHSAMSSSVVTSMPGDSSLDGGKVGMCSEV